MFSHIMLGITDFKRAMNFYRPVMDALGLEFRFVDENHPWAAWQPAGSDRPLFLIGQPYNKQVHAPGNGQMVAFLADSRQRVKQVYAAAMTVGGECEGPPNLRPEYHPHYYAAYFRDPDGNKLCVVCHAAE
ncbi:VOC family protein [Pseudomonas sp.]|uniref:VOC family protein n=1 Tax=Pseudomonas sp. TaxID=306 RepID=UPI003A96EB9F